MLFPQVLPEMLHAAYWLSRLDDPDATLLDAAEIAAFNRAIHHNVLAGALHLTQTGENKWKDPDFLPSSPAINYDLTIFPTRLSRNVLETWLTTPTVLTKPLYLNGQPVTPDYQEALHAKLNLQALATQNQVRYGFTIARTSIRTFPTTDPVLEEHGHPECDYFQETGINPAEPVLILHQNAASDWSYIQTGNYRGWAPTATLAVAASRSQWLDYLNSPAFLVVTASNFNVPGPTEKPLYYFEMGAKIPLAVEVSQSNGAFTAILPESDRQNRLQLKPVSLPDSADIHLGYLHYTRANLLRQAFKFCGQPYDWGGLRGGIDCSSLIMNLYRCFGFDLPRNTGEQEQIPGRRVRLETLNPTEKKAVLGSMQPGAVLYMKGHVMLFLGMVNDNPYIFQALSSHGVPDGLGNIVKNYPLLVTVTDLSLLRANGQTFLDSLQTAVIF
jgi:cell wall-associated NlpC family hydrolase